MTTAAPTLADATQFMRDAYRANRNQMVWLYAIRAGFSGPIKLGITHNPSERLATLQQGNADTLRGIAAWRGLPVEEKYLHADFDYARIRGEWFRPVPELVELVIALGGIYCDWEKL